MRAKPLVEASRRRDGAGGVQDVGEALARFGAQQGPERLAAMCRSVLRMIDEAERRHRALDTLPDEPTPGCRVCIHPERQDIDRALFFGQSPRSAARRYQRFGLSRADLQRHRDCCLSKEQLVE